MTAKTILRFSSSVKSIIIACSAGMTLAEKIPVTKIPKKVISGFTCPGILAVTAIKAPIAIPI